MNLVEQRQESESCRTLLGIVACKQAACPINQLRAFLTKDICDGLDVYYDISPRKFSVCMAGIANAELLIIGQSNPIHIAQVANHILHLRSDVDTHSRTEDVDEVVLGIWVVAKSVTDSARAAAAIFAEQFCAMNGHLLVEVIATAEHTLAHLIVDTLVHKGQTDIPRQQRRAIETRIITAGVLAIALLAVAWAVPRNTVGGAVECTSHLLSLLLGEVVIDPIVGA